MDVTKYLWSIYFFFMIIGQIIAQDEAIKLQEPTIYIPRNETQLLKYVESAQKDKKYTYCGDFYRRLRYEKDSKKRGKLDKQAVKFYKKAIKNGEVEAYHRMAYMCYYERGMKYDHKKCLDYLQQAVNKGYVAAQYNLGILYLYGNKGIVSKDINKAESLFINIGGTYSKYITVSSSKFLENNYRKIAIEWLIEMYTTPYYSKNGEKLNIEKAIKWSKKIEDQSILNKFYDLLSKYKVLTKWTEKYPHFLPGLKLRSHYDKVSTIDSVFQEIQGRLHMLGKERLKKLQNSLFDLYINSYKGDLTRTEIFTFLEQIRPYLKKKKSTPHIYEKCINKIKEMETNYAQKYPSVHVSSYLYGVKHRIPYYLFIPNQDYEAIQEIIFSPIDIQKLSTEELKNILIMLAGSKWRESNPRNRMITKGEKIIWKEENNLPKNTYWKEALIRWERYSKLYQQKSFNIAFYEVLKKMKEEKPIEVNSELRMLVPVPEKEIVNIKKLKIEILELIRVAKKLKLNYKFSSIENALFKIQAQTCYEAYKKNFTNKADLNCIADEKHYELKKAYYKSFLNRIRSDYDLNKIKEKMSDLLNTLLGQEQIHLSNKGYRHSYKNLWIFIHEFMLKLTPIEQKWIESCMSSYFKEKLCKAMSVSGKIRLHALVKENVQYSLKWHATHTAPNLIPLWSQEVKNSCSFCFYPAGGVYYNTKNEYDIYSPIEYAEIHMNNTDLVQFLKTLGVKKDQRDKKRKEQEQLQKEEEQKVQAIKEEKQKQHSKFLATLKVNDCVEGYIYYDCKPPFISQQYYRIKVSGRLVSVTENEYRNCFIKTTTIKSLELRSSGKWVKYNDFPYCDDTKSNFIDRELPIEKREILSRCY